MLNIIINEFKMLIRKRAFVYFNLVFIFSLCMVVWVGNIQNKSQNNLQKLAQNEVRDKWENLEPMNPHSAAHYGSYAFKTISSLNSIDNGINDITGNVIKLEGHVQNEIVYSEASQSITISKFGKLKASLLLQYVIPLMIIFISFVSIINEKKSGRIKLLIVQGNSIKKWIIAKSLCSFIYGIVLLILTLVIQIFNFPDIGTIQRLIILFFSYSTYYLIISFLATYFSAFMKSSSSTLSLILATWIIWTIFLPKIWGNTTEKIYPLPSRQTFQSLMDEERSKGIDGHNEFDSKRDELKNKLLTEYNVDSLSQLPLNFDGIVMQADEDYGNSIWDKYFGENYFILKRQKKLYQISGFLNPFASLQSLSMGLCGTDMIHHLDFLQKSENYRRYLIKALNDEHAYGGSKTGDWSWKVDNVFFKSINDFHYRPPKIFNELNNYSLDIISLIFWTLIVILLFINMPQKEIIK